MLIFFIKQMLSLKRAILGRREPHQLAWGMALGVLLGIVPHGNLIALAILLFILSLRVNHGMMAVTAVATSLFAAMLDAQTHGVGKYVLTHPDFAAQLSAAWQWPLVPWTDINNTVVMGSLLLGLAAILPTYLLSYPLFRYLAPPAQAPACEQTEQPSEPIAAAAVTDEASLVVCAPTASPPAADYECPPAAVLKSPPAIGGALILRPLGEAETMALGEAGTMAIDAVFADVDCDEPAAEQQAVDTRIEVVRLVDVSADSERAPREPAALAVPKQAAPEKPQGDPPMSEALNYLLRQLRDSRQRRAA